LLALFGERVCAPAVARLVGLVGAVEAGAALCCFLAREVAEAIIFRLRVGGGVVEGWKAALVQLE
jgi:hypothetical protein